MSESEEAKKPAKKAKATPKKKATKWVGTPGAPQPHEALIIELFGTLIHAIEDLKGEVKELSSNNNKLDETEIYAHTSHKVPTMQYGNVTIDTSMKRTFIVKSKQDANKAFDQLFDVIEEQADKKINIILEKMNEPE